MNRIRLIATALLAATLCTAPAQAAGEPAWIAVAELPGGSPLVKFVHGQDEPTHSDFWRGMIVAAHGQHYFLLMTERRVEALATPDWKYDAAAADWNQFHAQLVDLYQRIDFQ